MSLIVTFCKILFLLFNSFNCKVLHSRRRHRAIYSSIDISCLTPDVPYPLLQSQFIRRKPPFHLSLIPFYILQSSGVLHLQFLRLSMFSARTLTFEKRGTLREPTMFI